MCQQHYLTSMKITLCYCHCLNGLQKGLLLCLQVRLWMNYRTAVKYIRQIRSHVIHYMCSFLDKDLRLAATRNMTDLMWQALKEPRETTISYDKEGLDLAFKYFTCSVLTLRLAGIAQINVCFLQSMVVLAFL